MKFRPGAYEIINIMSFIASIKDLFTGKIAILVSNQILYSLFKISAKYSYNNGIDVNIFLKFSDAIDCLNERRSEKRPDIIVS